MRFILRPRWPAREPTASVPCPSRTDGTPRFPPLPLPDPWRTVLLRRSGYPSGDRLHQGEARSDLLTADRNFPGGFDAKPHLTINQLHHRHDDPIADHDSLTEFARQDQHGGLLPCWLRSERIRQPVPSVKEELNERMRKMQIPGFPYGESNMATNIASDKKPPSALPATKLRSMRWRGSSLDWQVLVWLSS